MASSRRRGNEDWVPGAVDDAFGGDEPARRDSCEALAAEALAALALQMVERRGLWQSMGIRFIRWGGGGPDANEIPGL
jgi:dienelactone hydrolase